MRKWGFVFAMIACFFHQASGQKAGRQFYHYSTNQGLSQNSITNIYQDSRGFMWFCTRDGLSRFDGYNFKVFRFDPSNAHSLSGNYINCITEDKQGNLWIGNVANQGLNRFDRKTGRFTHFLHDSANANSISDETIHDIITDRSGLIWIATRTSGLDRLDPATGKFTHFRNNPKARNSLSTDRLASLMQDRAGNIWVGTILDGVNRLDTKTGSFTRFLPDSTRRNMAANVVYDMAEDEAGTIWLATAAGVFTVHHETGLVERPAVLANIQDDVNAILINNAGEIWMAGWSGVHILDKSRTKLERHEHNPQNPNGINDKQVTRLFQDRSGITWLGTISNGINVYDPKQQKFPLYRFGPLNNQNPAANSVTAVHQTPENELWLGIRGDGIRRYNRSTGQITTYKYNPADKSDPKNAGSPSSANITCFLSDRQGLLWIGTEHGGLCNFNNRTGKFSWFLPNKADPKSLSSNWVLTLTKADDNHLWIGTNGGGLEKLDKRTGTFVHYPLNTAGAKPGEGEFVIDVEQNKDGSLWVGTVFNGLVHFNPATGKSTRYRQQSGKPNSLSYDNIGCVFKDSKGTLWVGTWGGGLNKFDKTTGKFSSYTIKNGLPSNSVFGILEDEQKQLWLSTSNGLSRFNPETGSFKNYDVHDGLQGNEFNPFGATFRSKTGELFFGGANGLTAFFPKQIKDNRFIPPVQVTDFTIISAEIGKQKVSEAEQFLQSRNIVSLDSLTLSYKDNIFSIGFAALSFTDTEENQYAYKMEGFDEHWIKAGSKREVTYTNLDPGTYVFRIKAANNDGIWNEEGKSVYITILPPPWLTWWAYCLYGLAFAALLFGLRRYWKRQERLKANLKVKELESEKLQEMDQLKTRFFTSISHEFRTPLTLILSPLEQLMANPETGQGLKNQFQMMHRNAQRLLQLINQLLDISKLEAGSVKIKAARHDLVVFTRTLVSSFMSLAETRKLQLEFSSGQSSLPAVFDADMLEKVLVNLISNAIKFTPDSGKILVQIEAENQNSTGACAIISVTDTGIGIPEDRLARIFNRFYQVDNSQTRNHEGTGIGLALVKELVQLHKGEITVASKPGAGSRFVVKLPLHNFTAQTEPMPPVIKKALFIDAGSVEDTAEETAEQEENILKGRSTLPTVLIVEDNRDVRTFIRDQFIENYKVTEAVNGKHGLKLAIELVPDIVISDLMMPGMDGIELCHELKTDERTSHIPVILLTAKAAIENRLEGLETGADDYITKPFQPLELQHRVRNLIVQAQRLREKYSEKTIKLEPGEITVTSKEEHFLKRAIAVVEEHMGNQDFDVEKFCREIGMSRMQLHRKLKAITGQTTTEFIRTLRLKRAAQLIDQDAGNIAEVAYQTGFQSLSYFSKCFKDHYGYSPSDYQARVSPEFSGE